MKRLLLKVTPRKREGQQRKGTSSKPLAHGEEGVEGGK